MEPLLRRVWWDIHWGHDAVFHPTRSTAMGSVGGDHFKDISPVVTPEGNVVMSFSFDSYQLEEEELQAKGCQAKGVLTFMEPGEGSGTGA